MRSHSGRFRGTAHSTGTFLALAGAAIAMLGLPAAAAASSSTLSVSNPSVVEGNEGTTSLVFKINGLCGNPSLPCTLQWQTADGTATLADGDYVQTSGSDTMGPGAFPEIQVSVPVNGDLNVEPGETMVLAASLDDQLPEPPSASGTGTIVNDDEGPAPDPDPDVDGVLDPGDNCPLAANADQVDLDGDGVGDACDDDVDGDGVANGQDNCGRTANADQTDINGNNVGDACDPQVGGAGNDNQQGTDGDDVQVGGGGNDVQNGGAGNDAQIGGGCGGPFTGRVLDRHPYQVNFVCLIRQIICPILDALAKGPFGGVIGPIISALRAVFGCPSPTKLARAGATSSGLAEDGNDTQFGGAGLDFQFGDAGDDLQKGQSGTDLTSEARVQIAWSAAGGATSCSAARARTVSIPRAVGKTSPTAVPVATVPASMLTTRSAAARTCAEFPGEIEALLKRRAKVLLPLP